MSTSAPAGSNFYSALFFFFLSLLFTCSLRENGRLIYQAAFFRPFLLIHTAPAQPFSQKPFSGADELRSNTPLPGGSLFLGSRFPVQPSCVSNTPLPGWGVSPSADGGNGFQKDRHPLRWFLSSWDSIFRPFGIPRSDGTQAFLHRGGTEKGERQYCYHLIGSA